jgi:nicotinamide riboside kinase
MSYNERSKFSIFGNELPLISSNEDEESDKSHFSNQVSVYVKKRIAFTGPESCGKTTIAKRFAAHVGGTYVEEFARTYLEKGCGQYNEEDLVTIAHGQWALWKQINGILVADTEMLVLKVWSEVRYGRTDAFIEESLKTQNFDHYFLCYPDIPWEPDSLREHPEQRLELFEHYVIELEKMNLPYSILKGDVETRLSRCLEVLSR